MSNVTRICAMNLCDSPLEGARGAARGYCHTHYERLRHQGKFDISPHLSPAERSTTCPVVINGEACTTGKRIVRGLCIYHYRQMVAGVPFKHHVLRRLRGSAMQRQNGQKQCARCLLWRDVNEFRPAKKAIDGLQSWCSPCSADWMTLRRYGLTRAEIERRVKEQGGCASCGTPQPRNEGFHNGWHVDHDHKCCPGDKTCGRCIRGILCAECNHLLGTCDDDVTRLLAAVEYLRSCEAKHEQHG